MLFERMVTLRANAGLFFFFFFEVWGFSAVI